MLITLALLLSSLSHAQIVPTTVAAYFKEDAFMTCLAESIAQSYDAKALYDKLNAISQRRHTLGTPTDQNCTDGAAALCEFAHLPFASQVRRLLYPVGCAFDRQIEESLIQHSTALTECTMQESATETYLGDVERWERQHRGEI